jgi:hypothetical protein
VYVEVTVPASLIRYRTHADRADDNTRLIEAVFAELSAAQPDGVRYTVACAPDATFYHLVRTDGDDITKLIPSLAAFKELQANIRERCVEPPQPIQVTIIGDYRR